MISAIIPQFFTSDLTKTLKYYENHLGFVTAFVYGEPAAYAGTARDGHTFFIRAVDQPPVSSPDKIQDELLDAYLIVNDAEALYAEYQASGVEFIRPIGNMPWRFREFVVRDIDGRLLCFGQALPQHETTA